MKSRLNNKVVEIQVIENDANGRPTVIMLDGRIYRMPAKHVNAEDLGGDAKVYGNDQLYGNAKVSGNALMFGDARAYEKVRVYGNAEVAGYARVDGYEIDLENAKELLK